MPRARTHGLSDHIRSLYLAHGMRVFAAIALACLALAWWLTFSQARATSYQSVKASTEAANSALTQVFVNQAWLDIRERLIPQRHTEPFQLAPATLDDIDRMVKQFCLHTDIVKIKIFNLTGTTIYSSEKNQIGEDKSASSGFKKALSGSAASEMTLRGSFNTLNGEIYDRNLVSSYIPITHGGEVEAVAEIYTDRTDAIYATNQALYTFGLTLSAIFVAVYGALVFFMLQARRVSDAHEKSLLQLAEESSAARQAAENATLVKSQFLATMSHEIRTPMNGILGTTQLLRDSPLNQEQATLVHLLQVSGESLLALLNDILDLSKIEAGRLDLDPHPFVLTELVSDVQALLSVRAQEKSIAFHTHFQPDLPARWHGDSLRIRQILLNLGGNAVKFTEQGHVRLDITADEGGVQFVFKDTGIGMSTATLNKLFTKFTQADASIARRHGGTGLGLAISQSLAEAMAGHIHVFSEQGQGSCFTLWLPLQALPPESPPSLPAVTTDSVATPPSPQSGQHVLVAEDNAINQKVIATMLERLGLKVTLAPNGAVAVDAATRFRYDLILMDMQMPEMDGLEASRRIRNLSSPMSSDVPIIALTANAMQTDREACLAAGMNDFLTKPLKAQELKNCLAHYISGTPRSHQA